MKVRNGFLDSFSSVQSLSHVQLFVTPWTAACQASLSTTNSRSLLNSCPLSWWCHPNISSSVIPFSFCLQSFPVSMSFPMSQLFTSGSTVNEAEVDIFLEHSCFFYDPADVGSLISGSSAFSKSSLNIWKFTVHVLLKPGLENFEHYFASVWNECNCAIVWTSFGIAFLQDWNENWPFLVLWPLLSFPNSLAYWVQHFHSIIFQDLK